MTAARRTLLGPALAALVLIAAPAAADSGDGWPDRFGGFAAAVWEAVGDGRSIAARPVDPDETGLPPDLAARIDTAILRALLRAAPPGGRVIDRGALPASWAEAMSFQGAPDAELLRDAAVEALVVPAARATATGVTVGATVVGVGGGDTGRLLAAIPAVELPAAVERLVAVPPAVAARIAGVALAEALRLHRDAAGSVRATVRLAGDRSPFGDWFMAAVAERLVARLAERPLYVTRPIRAATDRGDSLTIRLQAEIWDHGDRVDAHLRAVTGDGEARATVRLDAAALPASFRPLTPSGGQLRTGYRIADGKAATGPELRRDELSVAAEAAARARLVEDEIGDGAAVPAILRSRAGLAAAWRRLAAAVPYDEAWSGVADDNESAARRLRARVAVLGGPEAPELAAALDRATYRPDDPIRLRLSVVRGRAFVAAYAWQADGSVVRIAPFAGGAPVTVEAGRRVDLPGPNDAEVTAAPMPGVAESLEAIAVVASAVPFDPDRLAPGLGTSPEASRRAAASLGAFLDRLAGLDRGRLRLVVLPYRVRPGE